jgi:hypothetical protein
MFFFLMYRPSCLIEAYGSTEKCLSVYVRLLAAHLFNEDAIFLPQLPPGSDRMSGRSYGCSPLLASLIPWRWTDERRLM